LGDRKGPKQNNVQKKTIGKKSKEREWGTRRKESRTKVGETKNAPADTKGLRATGINVEKVERRTENSRPCQGGGTKRGDLNDGAASKNQRARVHVFSRICAPLHLRENALAQNGPPTR